MDNQQIDAVIIWVDGSDPKWQQERLQYLPHLSQEKADNRMERYRDMGILRYLFRGLEAYAPWLRTVHFITCGQKPAWLNCKAPKLHFVSHAEYIPPEYLPTFNSDVIELNLHRIDNLSEKFIYFNDDQFLINYVTPNDFFYRDLPKQSASFLPTFFDSSDAVFSGILNNNLKVIYRNFSRKSFFKHILKHISLDNGGLKNSLRNIKNIYLMRPGIEYSHLPVPLLKSSISDLWNIEPSILRTTSMNKFRSSEDVNQFLIQLWQIASGNYSPTNVDKNGKYFYLPNSYPAAAECIKKQHRKTICLNDGRFTTDDEYQRCVSMIKNAFDEILPYKSSYEL